MNMKVINGMGTGKVKTKTRPKRKIILKKLCVLFKLKITHRFEAFVSVSFMAVS